jgi:hypothetical protein
MKRKQGSFRRAAFTRTEDVVIRLDAQLCAFL